MRSKFPDEDPTELIEIPNHLQKKHKVNLMDFSPIHIDGYAQLPRQSISPYANLKEMQKRDIKNKIGLKTTTRFFGEASRNLKESNFTNPSIHIEN